LHKDKDFSGEEWRRGNNGNKRKNIFKKFAVVK